MENRLFTCSFFPTCQVTVVRFYDSCSSSFLPSFLLASFLANLLANRHRQSSSPIFFANLLRRSCLASSGSQCAPLDLNRKDPIAVCTPGPQPQGSDRSVHPWTSTARIRIPSQCAHLDLNRKDPIAVCIPGPQPQGSDRSVHPWTSTARIRSQCAPLDLNQVVCQIKCQIECQVDCQIECCKKICRIVCQIVCQIDC